MYLEDGGVLSVCIFLNVLLGFFLSLLPSVCSVGLLAVLSAFGLSSLFYSLLALAEDLVNKR